MNPRSQDFIEASDPRDVARILRNAADAFGPVAKVIEAARHTFAGRLSLELRADGSVRVDYCTGQYWPTEYRAAVAAVLKQVSREAYARASELRAA